MVLCDLQATGAGTTQCNWSLFFDGSAAGFNTRVHGVDVLPNGSLIIRVASDASLPDISAIKRTDLALFIPQNPLSRPYTIGEWRLYLDATPSRVRATRACGIRSTCSPTARARPHRP